MFSGFDSIIFGSANVESLTALASAAALLPFLSRVLRWHSRYGYITLRSYVGLDILVHKEEGYRPEILVNYHVLKEGTQLPNTPTKLNPKAGIPNYLIFNISEHQNRHRKWLDN